MTATLPKVEPIMKLRSLAAGVAAFATVIALTACGGEDDKTPAQSGSLGGEGASSQTTQAARFDAEEIEKSLIFVQTTWKGYVWVPGSVTNDGQGFWSSEITAYSSCSGFFVSDDGMVATAGHCVDAQVSGREAIINALLTEVGREDLLETAMTNWTVEGRTAGAPIVAEFDVIQSGGTSDAVVTAPRTAQLIDFQAFQEGDNALLRVNGLSGTTPLTIASGDPEIGSEVISIGWPAVIRTTVDSANDLNRPSFKKGEVSSRQSWPSGAPVTEVSSDIGGGMSGGPSVNEQGEVLGINSAGIGEVGSLGFNFITDTNDLRMFLKRNGIE